MKRIAARRSGSGQTSAGAARCTRGCDRGDRPGPARVARRHKRRAPAGARAAGSIVDPSRGITSVPARMCIRHQQRGWENSGEERRAVGARVSAADRSWSRSTHDGQARPGHPVRRGALLATADVRPSLPPVRPGGGAPCRDRTHRGARDWQRMGGWKGASVADGPGGPRRRCWPGHGISRGSSNRGARCPSDHRSVAGG